MYSQFDYKMIKAKKKKKDILWKQPTLSQSY